MNAPSPSSLYLCLTTLPSSDSAQALASQIIESRLAACVQVEPDITSTYRWQGKVETASEARLAIYSTGPLLGKLEAFVTKNHPYDTPKWVCIRAEKVSGKYLKWASDACSFASFT